MFLEESNPAANMRAVYGSLLSHTILQANLEMVLCVIWASSFWQPETVSVTTKSIGLSVDLPTWINQTLSWLTWKTSGSMSYSQDQESRTLSTSLSLLHRLFSLSFCLREIIICNHKVSLKSVSFHHGTTTVNEILPQSTIVLVCTASPHASRGQKTTWASLGFSKPPVSTSSALKLLAHTNPPGDCVCDCVYASVCVFGDLNLGPHSWEARSLPIELSP